MKWHCEIERSDYVRVERKFAWRPIICSDGWKVWLQSYYLVRLWKYEMLAPEHDTNISWATRFIASSLQSAQSAAARVKREIRLPSGYPLLKGF